MEVRPPPFHIAHWTAQHSVGEDDILSVAQVRGEEFLSGLEQELGRMKVVGDCICELPL